MKFFLLLTLLFGLVYKSVGQPGITQLHPQQDKKEILAISESMKTNDVITAIENINILISKYPSLGYLYKLRGRGKLALNDVEGSRTDFIEAEKWLSYGDNSDDQFIKSIISKKYMVELLMKDLGYDLKLDPLRDFKPVIEAKDTLQGALRKERKCYDVYFYDLTVKILPKTRSIEGTNEIYFRTISNTRTIQIDLFPQYTISKIEWNGKRLNFTRILGAVFIDFGQEIISGALEKISVEYKGVPGIAPRPPWLGGFVWGKERGKYIVGVACEHLGASSWWPNKDHLSDKPDSMRINIQVPNGYQAISNGSLRTSKETADNYTNFEWFVSYPINNYNVSFYMGDFVNFNEKFTNNNGSYMIDYYVLPRNLQKAKEYYVQTKGVLSVFEKVFGEYPFRNDGVGMVEAPYEGMEHQGAIAIGGEYGKNRNKREYWTEEFDYLVVHETAHEWWGNAVSICDMSDAWISEGFATYSEYLFAEEKFGYPEYVKAAASNQMQILNIWPIVGQTGINDNTFIGSDIYNKGAAMLNNLRCIINNDSIFKSMIKAYYEKYKYKTTTTEDFVNLVHEYTKNDYSDFFNKFLYDNSPPVLQCNYIIDEGNSLAFSYKWINVGKNFSMPFCIAVNNTEYYRLNGSTLSQLFIQDSVKSFFLPNEFRYEKDLVPENSFTYYWTDWPF